MKKKILLFCTFMAITNVHAMPIYSDYTFIGYQEEKGVESDLYKYEEVTLNRFYKIGETNIVYAPYENKFENSPYLDKDSYIPGTIYRGNRDIYGNPRFVQYLRTEEDYHVKSINIHNIYLRSNVIYEIKVFHKDKEISFTVDNPNYDFLNDDNMEIGFDIAPAGFTMTLDDLYNINDLKIDIYYSCVNYNSVSLYLNMINEDGGKSIDHPTGFETLASQYKKVSIEFKDKDAFIRLILENNMLHPDLARQVDLRSSYEYETKLYKHYNNGKVYYIMSPLSKLDGYTYDKEESIKAYMVFKREIIGNTDDNVVNEIQDDSGAKVEETNIETFSAASDSNIQNTKNEIIISDNEVLNNSEGKIIKIEPNVSKINNTIDEEISNEPELYYDYHVEPIKRESSNKNVSEILSKDEGERVIKKEKKDITPVHIVLIIIDIILLGCGLYKIIKNIHRDLT